VLDFADSKNEKVTMKIIDSAKSGIDLTHPRLDAQWIVLFIAFAVLIMFLVYIAKWIVSRVNGFTGQAVSTGPIAAIVEPSPASNKVSDAGWDF